MSDRSQCWRQAAALQTGIPKAQVHAAQKSDLRHGSAAGARRTGNSDLHRQMLNQSCRSRYQITVRYGIWLVESSEPIADTCV